MLQVTRQEQRQKLALTQSMQLSIHILQKGAQALERYVEQELLENPFLDCDMSLKVGGAGHASSAYDASLATSAYKPSLSEYLVDQLDGLGLTSRQKSIAQQLVHCLDESGFLGQVDDDLASLVGTSVGEINSIMPLLQTLEPIGVFAENLMACLALQLHEQGVYSTEYSLLLDNMEMIADGRHDEVCALCEVSHFTLNEMLSSIAELNFRPCEEFDSHEPQSVKIPDILMIRDSETIVHAELNPDALPTLLLDDALFSTVKETTHYQTDNRYYLECYNRAAWLIVALQKRANTMLSIASELAELQNKFILSGRFDERVPLQMQTIASRLGLNKSTVSRALVDRSIKTEWGVFDTKDFFVRKANSKLENTTIEGVYQVLLSLIGTESDGSVYSDQALCDQLSNAGMQVSRRSVSNYRKSLDIPSASIRKKNLRSSRNSRSRVNFHF